MARHVRDPAWPLVNVLWSSQPVVFPWSIFLSALSLKPTESGLEKQTNPTTALCEDCPKCVLFYPSALGHVRYLPILYQGWSSVGQSAFYPSGFQTPKIGNDLRVGYKDYVTKCFSRAWRGTGHLPALHKEQIEDFPPEASLQVTPRTISLLPCCSTASEELAIPPQWNPSEQITAGIQLLHVTESFEYFSCNSLLPPHSTEQKKLEEKVLTIVRIAYGLMGRHKQSHQHTRRLTLLSTGEEMGKKADVPGRNSDLWVCVRARESSPEEIVRRDIATRLLGKVTSEKRDGAQPEEIWEVQRSGGCWEAR